MENHVPPYFSSFRPFEALFRAGAPIITYHSIAPRPRGVRMRGNYLHPRLFRSQLKELKLAGLKAGTLGIAQPGEIVLTFDDGYRSVFESALPILNEFGFKALLFLVSGEIGGSNSWDIEKGEKPAALMNQEEIREWLASGHAIGAHTVTHPRLTELPREKMREEIYASKSRLEDLFSVPIVDFCYPYGSFDESVREEVKEAGFKTAVTTKFGANLKRDEDLFELSRIPARHKSFKFKELFRKKKNHTAAERGFTLIELSFVAILLALLGGIIYGSITTLVRSKDALEERRTTERTAEAIFSKLTRELENHTSDPLTNTSFLASAATPTPAPGQEQQLTLLVGKSYKIHGANADSIHFTTVGNPASNELGNPGVIEVEYRLLENLGASLVPGGQSTFTLLREEAPAVIDDQKVIDQRRLRAALSDRVRSLQFRYRFNRRWINQWSTSRDTLPDAVEITLVLATDTGESDTYRTAVALNRTD